MALTSDAQYVHTTPDRMPLASRIIYAFALVTAITAVIVAVNLFSHTVPSDCYDANPYGLSYYSGPSVECDSTAHPWAGAGAAVLISGAVQTFLLAVVARLCTSVSDLRTFAHRHQMPS